MSYGKGDNLKIPERNSGRFEKKTSLAGFGKRQGGVPSLLQGGGSLDAKREKKAYRGKLGTKVLFSGGRSMGKLKPQASAGKTTGLQNK